MQLCYDKRLFAIASSKYHLVITGFVEFYCDQIPTSINLKKDTLTSHCHLVVTYSCGWWISNVNERRLVVSFKCDYLLQKCQPLNTYHVGKIATYLSSVFRVWFIKYSPNMDRCFGSSRNVLSQRRRSSIFKHAGQVKYDMKSSSFELAGRGIKPWTR